VPDVDHPAVLHGEVERPFPRRVIAVEEERGDAGADRMEGGLEDSVGDPIAGLHPLLCLPRGAMVPVSLDRERIVVAAVAIDDDPALAWDPGEDPGQVEAVELPDGGRPFEDEDHGVGRLHIQ
jgi:hypothetical protein